MSQQHQTGRREDGTPGKERPRLLPLIASATMPGSTGICASEWMRVGLSASGVAAIEFGPLDPPELAESKG